MKLQVLNWQLHFENNKSRERDRCSFVCIPNKMGMGLAAMLSEPDGSTMYGIFCLLIGLLSRQNKPREGHLTDTGRAQGRHLTGTELSLLWRRPVSEIDRCFEFICRPNIAWAIDLDQKCPPSARVVPAECPPSALERRKEGTNEEKGIEEKGIEENPLTPKGGGGDPDGEVLTIVKNPTRADRVAVTPIPPQIDTQEFRDAWQDWQAHRREMKKPLTPTTVKQQLRDFGAIGSAAAVIKIRQSIANGWQGLFEPKGNSNAQAPTSAEHRREQRAARECPENLTL